MDGKSVKKLFMMLARSQGLYGRLLRDIEDSEDPEAIYDEIGDGCDSDIDVIMKIEG